VFDRCQAVRYNFSQKPNSCWHVIGGPANVDTVIKFCKGKYPTPFDQEAGMRAAFQALDKDGWVEN
jgi:hypothetical protein